ncbi:hypothetical protein ERO13_D11G081700v2 [Gossypium hirsutum]|uniref:Uncharacterized protein n=3 Tax=Gossypium TaxID=3633 RepID=A0A1U8L5Y7_GOSHI|nr:uncharacterized protein LOC107923095 [Gossypium hirsutum]KAG4119453.1 hypothetical protein ERO13_D11G081700v2 [Gossypium hirsutum]TYG44320.1 hypothetical protein ES288_D11G088700v1 [Gossypium darwinii]TYH42815.1 hypothetical protein ES332_D11G087800v1 [Gossypium tomentosum]
MGGGTMHIDFPKIQLNSSSTTLSAVSSSSSHNLNLSVPSNYASPLRPSSSSSSSSSCQNEICKRLEVVDGNENKIGTGSFNNFILGPVPSKPEVETALAALHNYIHGISSSTPEFKWLKPLLDSCHSRGLLCQGLGRVYDGFILLLTEPSVKRLVVSISSDKAVWDAIKNNELVRKLLDLPLPAVENGRPGNSSGEAEPDNDILQWILDFAKAKVTELVLKFQSLLNEVFRSGKREKPNEETRGQLEEEIRSSLILSIVMLLIVIVARVQTV